MLIEDMRIKQKVKWFEKNYNWPGQYAIIGIDWRPSTDQVNVTLQDEDGMQFDGILPEELTAV